VLDRYWAFKNAWSMDGLPGMKRGVETGKTDAVKPIKKMVGPHAPLANGSRPIKAVYGAGHLILVALLSSILTGIAVLLVLLYGPGASKSRASEIW
jgi:hypothetical protein